MITLLVLHVWNYHTHLNTLYSIPHTIIASSNFTKILHIPTNDVLVYTTVINICFCYVTVATIMNGNKQQSTLPREKEESYLQIDLSNPENLFDFSVRSNPKPISVPPDSDLCLLVAEPPQKLSDLTTNSHHIQIVDRENGKKKKKPFNCDQCEKSFHFFAHLKRHILVHTGERPYCCRICNKRFQRSDYVRTHINHHKKEPVHNCSVCNMNYYDWNVFVTHCLSHDASEYRKKDSTIKVEKQSNMCYATAAAKQIDSSNSLQKATEAQTPLSEKSTIDSPVYSSNCRPLSGTTNYLPYNTTRPTDQYLTYTGFPHQQTFTLNQQKHQPLLQSYSQDYYNQPPQLIPISSLDYSITPCATNNATLSLMEYSSQEVLYSQDQQLILQSFSQDDITQPPALIRL